MPVHCVSRVIIQMNYCGAFFYAVEGDSNFEQPNNEVNLKYMAIQLLFRKIKLDIYQSKFKLLHCWKSKVLKGIISVLTPLSTKPEFLTLALTCPKPHESNIKMRTNKETKSQWLEKMANILMIALASDESGLCREETRTKSDATK